MYTGVIVGLNPNYNKKDMVKMTNKGKSLTKKPRNKDELKILEETARTIGGDTMKTYLLMRYGGMHSRVIFPFDYADPIKIKKCNLREGIDGDKRQILEWDRPKKRGASAYTTIPKHPNIDFNVDSFIKKIFGRSSKIGRASCRERV